jgi:hypothetical protein
MLARLSGAERAGKLLARQLLISRWREFETTPKCPQPGPLRLEASPFLLLLLFDIFIKLF